MGSGGMVDGTFNLPSPPSSLDSPVHPTFRKVCIDIIRTQVFLKVPLDR